MAAASWEQESTEPGGGTSVQADKVVGAAVVVTGAAVLVTAVAVPVSTGAAVVVTGATVLVTGAAVVVTDAAVVAGAALVLIGATEVVAGTAYGVGLGVGALVTGAAVVVVCAAVVVTGTVLLAGASVLGTVVVVGATVVVPGAAVVELGAAGGRQGCQDCESSRSTVVIQTQSGLGPRHTPEVVVPGGRVLFALASSTLVGLVVVGAAVEVAGTAVAEAAAGWQECMCQQRPSSS